MRDDGVFRGVVEDEGEVEKGEVDGVLVRVVDRVTEGGVVDVE